MRLPAPIPDQPSRSASDSWTTLYVDLLARFHPGVTDMEVLETLLEVLSKWELETYAPPARRVPAEDLNPAELQLENEKFGEYVDQFLKLTGDLVSRRPRWLDVAPPSRHYEV